MCFYPVVKEIALPTYLKQIGQLLEERRYPEVVLHAQHLLRHYPRHIVTYRLLGQALLEQQDYTGATDLLQRVLSADPNDLIAHLGLSIAYSEEALYSQAIWHLLHAYEMDPYNVNIQRELRELYRQRDGEYVSQLSISPAALARLHFRGGQYQRASGELREILQGDTEDRIDLEVLLAESLWRNRQRLEAAEVCETVLAKLPNCITANAILAEIHLLGERVSAATPYLSLVQSLTQVSQFDLDPESVVGAAFALPGALVLPAQVAIVPLDEQAVAAALGLSDEPVTPTIAEWVSGYGVQETAVSDETLYHWLDDVMEEQRGDAVDSPNWLEPAPTEAVALEPLDRGEMVGLLQALGGDDAEDDLPDWLRTGGVLHLSVDGSVDGDVVESDLPEWLLAGETAVDVALAENGGSQERQQTVAEDSVAENKDKTKNAADMGQSGSHPESLDDALAWLDELIGSNEAAPKAVTADDDEVPDWLQELSGLPRQTDDAVANDDLPDWLKEASLTTETRLPKVLDVDDDIIEAEISPIDTDLSWLDALTAESPAVGDEMPTMTWEGESDEPQDFDEAMAWLEELAAGQKTPIEEPPTIARGLFGTEVLSGKGGEKPVAQEGPSLEEMSEPPSDALDEAMAWLDELAVEDKLVERPSLAEAARGATNAALQAEEPEDEAMAWLDELAELSDSETAVDDELADALNWLEIQTADDEAGSSVVEAELPTQAFRQLEDDLAWLEQVALFDEDDVVEPVVEPETAVVASLADEIPDDPDATLAWLEQMAWESQTELAEDEAGETAAMVEAVAEEDSTFEVPEDPDEAIAWLEQLAARQGASLDELPSLRTEEPEPEMLADGVAEVPEDPDEAMAWLEQLAARQGAPLDELPTVLGLVAPETAVLPDEPTVSGADEAEFDPMAWLDELAAEADVALEPETAVVAEVADEADDLDAMAWLDELAAEADVALEPETAVVAEVADEADDLDAMAWLGELAAEADVVLEPETAVVAEVADEADDLDAMAWLGELAAEADVALEPETAVVAEVADEADDLDAMAWLGELAAEADVALEPETAVVAELDEADEPETAVVAEVADEADDLDAMAWLDELAAEADVVLEPETAVVAEVEPTVVAAIDSLPPDDLDEAMAWLEQLAAQQGAPLAELPSLHGDAVAVGAVEEAPLVAGEAAVADDEAYDEVAEAMAWLDELELDDEPETAVVANEAADADEQDEEVAEAMAWLDELADSETVAEAALSDEEGIPEWLSGAMPDMQELDEVVADEPEDAIPDWLTPEPSASVGDTGWLRSLAEPDMTGWLSSEEEATTGKLVQDGFGTDVLEERPFVPPTGEQQPVVEPMGAMEAPSLLTIDEERLTLARGAMARGDVETAVGTYQTLLTGGSGLSILIADLESATVSTPRQMPIHQLLGDAYMQNGQLQKALEAYRQALKVL